MEELGLTCEIPVLGDPSGQAWGMVWALRPGTREVLQLCGAKRAEAGPEERGHRFKRLGQEENAGKEPSLRFPPPTTQASPCPLYRLAFVPFPRFFLL